jgi:hypothetical protein
VSNNNHDADTTDINDLLTTLPGSFLGLLEEHSTCYSTHEYASWEADPFSLWTVDASTIITNSSIFWEPLLNPLSSGCITNQHGSGVMITGWKTDLVLILVVVRGARNTLRCSDTAKRNAANVEIFV